MKPISPTGSESVVEIDLISITRNPETGDMLEDVGLMAFKEILIFHDDLYIATVRCNRLAIDFCEKRVIDLNPKLSASRSDTSYQRIRGWIAKAQEEIASHLLKEMPHVKAINPLSGKPDVATDFEAEMGGYQLFADLLASQSS